MIPELAFRGAFNDARTKQALSQGRTFTPFDRSIGNVVLQASILAMEDVKQKRGVFFRVVSAPTGSGKTQSAVAVIAAAFHSDPSFSAAYIVDTIGQAEDVGNDLATLIGKNNVTVWTTAHDIKAKPEVVYEEYRFTPSWSSKQENLKSSRVIVCTHNLWKSEMSSGKDKGVRNYDGNRRSVLFVDEHPDLVKLLEKTPADVMRLYEAVLSINPEPSAIEEFSEFEIDTNQHPWVPVLSRIIARMKEAFGDEGANYAAANIITPDEGSLFSGISVNELLKFTDAVIPLPSRYATAKKFEEVCRFLSAASCGFVFLARVFPRAFIAYEFEFDAGPGHVLLDATADITGMVALVDGMEGVEVPKVNYRNLEITHIEHPKAFKNIRSVTKQKKTAVPYANWIKRTVLANTKPGDEVLVVAHLGLFLHEYLEQADDPALSIDWDGRRVNTLHWGKGIGTNRWKAKAHVFLFSEFYVPRRRSVANVHAYTKRPPTDEALKQANAGEPQGDYLTAHEGHLLRWTKQLACRGNVRNIDAEGNCGKMKLFTSMSFSRLIGHLDRLFPGAKPPSLLCDYDNQGRSSQGNKGLIQILATSTEDSISASDVHDLTGIPTRNLGRSWNTREVQVAAKLFGWFFVPGKGRGKCGRLIRTIQKAA